MASKNIAVYGIYENRSMAEDAVDELKNSGFRADDISVLFPESEGTKEFAVEKRTKTPEGASTGAGTGAVIGGTLGWLTGIGMLAIPGLGPFIAAGPIMAALAGAGAGGVVGGVAGALIGMGIPEYEANRYEGRIKEGGILLSVHADDREWKDKAKNILERTGAEDIGFKGEENADLDARDERSSTDRFSADRTSDEKAYAARPTEAPYTSGSMESDRSFAGTQSGSPYANEKRHPGVERRRGERRKSGSHLSGSQAPL